MLQRGRKSEAASAAIIKLPGTRIDPPRDMPETQRALWHKVIATKSPEWFTPDTLPLLEQYCRHVDSARLIEQMIAAPHSFDDLDKLLKARDRETKTILRLAAAMRISQQSRSQPVVAQRATKNASLDKIPWQENAQT